jgi:dTDP-4-dehydrorhamnose reductase
MNVLVTGAGGQLGAALQACVPDGIQCLAVDRRQLDITDAAALARTLDDACIAAVINAAAYTDVERAEREPDEAMRINATASTEIARACAAHGAHLIHVSTDFVFDGRQLEPYRPADATNPLSAYGRSKLEGEREVLSILGKRACVLRTSWLHSARGANFVTKILARMQTAESVRVVTDEIGSPTAAYSLAPAAWACAQRSVSGIHHWSDAGAITRFEFAEAIASDAYELGLLAHMPELQPARIADFNSAAQRPAYSVLDTRETQTVLGMKAIHWRDGLRSTLTRLVTAKDLGQ